ncbi:MAG TPA: hypothetical protein PK490_04390 [Prosthecobacter sp.]|nr:hypothetical protein [Prosthecobacter sp.]HRK13501.1 hypothetical protein [Prosthecobacter sp.]
MACSLKAQVVREEAPADAGAALIHHWPGPWQLMTEAKALALPDDASHSLDDFAIAFRVRVEKAPGGDHPLDMLTLEADAVLHLKVQISPSGHLSCSTPNEAYCLFGDLPPGREVPVVVNVKRDARQALSGLWVDGVEMSSAVIKPWRAGVSGNVFYLGSQPLPLTVSDIRLYRRALTRSEILSLPLPGESRRLPAMGGRFELMQDEVLAVLGGSEAVAVLEEGSLEALLMRAHAAQLPRVRSLAWEADTVFRQDRPLNFGSLPLQLRRCEATCVLMMFGRQECLERGAEGVADFEAACGRVIAQVKEVTPRLVIVEAAPFEKKAPPLPDLTPKNAALALYNEALRRLAEKHGAFFAGSGESWHHTRPEPLTRDGVNLTEAGAREVGLRVLASTRALEQSEPAALLAAVREKNRLWHHYWRPDNWAFLHGDRTAQPSSRDHLNPRLRWFPAELERYRALIAEKEQEIWKLAQPPKVP